MSGEEEQEFHLGLKEEKSILYATYSCRLKYQSIHFMANFSGKVSFQEL